MNNMLKTNKSLTASQKSNNKTLLTVGVILCIVLFFMPLLTSWAIGEAFGSHEYDSLQVAGMGLFNLPMFIASLMTILIALNARTSKNKKILAWISIAISLAGIVFMVSWAVSAAS